MTEPARAPENQAAHIRELEKVGLQQAERIKQLADTNAKLRSQNTRLKNAVDGRLDV